MIKPLFFYIIGTGLLILSIIFYMGYFGTKEETRELIIDEGKFILWQIILTTLFLACFLGVS